jgi:hypothetical protein
MDESSDPERHDGGTSRAAGKHQAGGTNQSGGKHQVGKTTRARGKHQAGGKSHSRDRSARPASTWPARMEPRR